MLTRGCGRLASEGRLSGSDIRSVDYPKRHVGVRGAGTLLHYDVTVTEPTSFSVCLEIAGEALAISAPG